MAPKKGFIPANKKYIDLELMEKLYYQDMWDYRRLAKYFGFKSISPIYERFKKLGLKARDNTDIKTGFKHSEETKRKISLAGLGRSFSEETLKGMRLRVLGNKNPMWIGGRIIDGQGYIKLHNPTHPEANYSGYVREHRLVWEMKNGKIPEGYIIHHINGVRDDNRIENLKLLTKSEHTILHNTGKKANNPRDSVTGKFLKKIFKS